MLTFPLKKQWFEKIKSGKKTIEYREVKDYWKQRLKNEFSNHIPQTCKLRLGYTNQYMTAKITGFEIVNGKNTDLAIDKPVYAIHLADVSEIKTEPLDKWHN